MSYLHRLFLVIVLGAVLEGSDDERFSPPASPVLGALVARSVRPGQENELARTFNLSAPAAQADLSGQECGQEGTCSLSTNEDFRRLEQEISNFKEKLSKRNFEAGEQYSRLSSDPLFLTDERFVNVYLSSFHEDQLRRQKEDEDELNELAKKVSSLGRLFRTYPSGLAENPTNSLFAMLALIEQENGLKINPISRVPSLRLPQEGSFGLSGWIAPSSLFREFSLGSGVRAADLLGAPGVSTQPAVSNDRSAALIRLGNKFVDHNELSDGESNDEEVVPTDKVVGDNCGGISSRVPTVASVVRLQEPKGLQSETNKDKSIDELYEML